jgi:mevalonate kinase
VNAFATEVPGKWVLAGEHTVLRGGSAIALPHPEFRLRLMFTPGSGEPVIETELLAIAKNWLEKRGVAMRIPRGELQVTSTIPIGAGLGSSAALSVALARWILEIHTLSGSSRLEIDLARDLEDRFHGKSSGMDVAVVSLGVPIWFSMKDGAAPLGLRRLPKFVFADTGLRASTRDCIARVTALRISEPKRGETLDKDMALATLEILRGLQAADVGAAEVEIARGMKRAGDVFTAWGLVPDSAHELMRELEREGVLSPRITGAGGGGFIVGLVSEAKRTK